MAQGAKIRADEMVAAVARLQEAGRDPVLSLSFATNAGRVCVDVHPDGTGAVYCRNKQVRAFASTEELRAMMGNVL